MPELADGDSCATTSSTYLGEKDKRRVVIMASCLTPILGHHLVVIARQLLSVGFWPLAVISLKNSLPDARSERCAYDAFDLVDVSAENMDLVRNYER